MVSLQQGVIIFAALAALVSSAFAINCYQCLSTLNDKCGEEFNPAGVEKIDCSTPPVSNLLQKLLPIKNATGCMKAVEDVLGKKHTLRGCYFGDIKVVADCKSSLNISGINQNSCDICTDDLCNGSSVTTTAPIALAIAMLALLAHKLY